MALGLLNSNGLSETQRRILFYIGVAFLVLLFIDLSLGIYSKEERDLYDMTYLVLLFVFGTFLIMPKQALKFLEAIPIPQFLRRGSPPTDTPSPPHDHSDSESGESGPSTGEPPRSPTDLHD